MIEGERYNEKEGERRRVEGGEEKGMKNGMWVWREWGGGRERVSGREDEVVNEVVN